MPPQLHGRKRFPWRRLIITAIILIFVVALAVVISNFQSSIILAILGIAIGLFQWFFPLTFRTPELPKSSISEPSEVPFHTSSTNSIAHRIIVEHPIPTIQQDQIPVPNNERSKIEPAQVQPDSVF